MKNTCLNFSTKMRFCTCMDGWPENAQFSSPVPGNIFFGFSEILDFSDFFNFLPIFGRKCPQIDPKFIPDRPQINPRSTPNRPQIDPRSTPDRSQIDPKPIPNQSQIDTDGWIVHVLTVDFTSISAGSVPSRGAKDFGKWHLWDFTSISAGSVPSRGAKDFEKRHLFPSEASQGWPRELSGRLCGQK